ncbi:MAG: flagellar biosynthesis protein FlhB [Planctomycetes bacterium]|nr:flagellar biosynthesis protein FlhB [Planctomycetota bacterium]
MPLFGDDQGKTEQPTPSRLAEVRNRGDTPMSRELVQGGVLMAAALAFDHVGQWLVDALQQTMRRGLDTSLRDRSLDEVDGACRELLGAVFEVGPPLATLVATLVAATLLLGYAQIGVRWSHEVVGFKLDRLNPFTNWKKVFNVQALVRSGFAAVKLGIIVGALWFVLGDRWSVLLRLHEQPFLLAAAEIADLSLELLFWIGSVVFALAFVDFAWQRWSFTQRNMMTKQEVEDERRRSEGDPTVKMRQRRARNELMRQRMMEAVPKADVIVTNPTHFSVALRYDRRRDAAPTVVAKGVDEVAMRIREIAREHGVPLMEDPPLARALFRAVKVGQTIPERFYQAVATVLSHVYRLQGRTA